VSCGHSSVLSSSSNLNSPTPQEQSGVIVGAEEEVGTKDGIEEVDGAEEEVGLKETDGDVDGAEDGGVEGTVDGSDDGEKEGREEVEGSIDGGEDDVGIKDGIEVGLMVGREDNVGLDETDGDVDGTPRSRSHAISILSASKCASHKAYRLGFPHASLF